MASNNKMNYYKMFRSPGPSSAEQGADCSEYIAMVKTCLWIMNKIIVERYPSLVEDRPQSRLEIVFLVLWIHITSNILLLQ